MLLLRYRIMTEQEFLKKRFKSFERINCKNSRDTVVECMLIGVDFEQRLFKLEPFPNDYYEEKSFWARCDYCERPRPKLKLAK